MFIPTLKYLYSLKIKAKIINKKHPSSFLGSVISSFKGSGLEFYQARKYNFGDEIKNIDWNITARTGQTHVKEYIEEKEHDITIIGNVGKEMYFSSRGKFKYYIMSEIVTLISFITEDNKEDLQIFFLRIQYK